MLPSGPLIVRVDGLTSAAPSLKSDRAANSALVSSVSDRPYTDAQLPVRESSALGQTFIMAGRRRIRARKSG
jgi:hypothetical protein